MDVGIELYEKIKLAYSSGIRRDKRIAELLKKASDGNAKYSDVYDIAQEYGEALATAFEKNLSSAVLPDGKMYWNIAKTAVEPFLVENQLNVIDYAQNVQNQLNQAAGFGFKAVGTKVDYDTIEGILNRLSSEDDYDSVSWILKDPVVTNAMKTVDRCVDDNVSFAGVSGLRPKVTRITIGRCCAWCEEVAGVYSYPDVPKDVYRRHENCRCIVEYDPGDGSRQNVWSKEVYTNDEAVIRNRKIFADEKLKEEIEIQNARTAAKNMPHNVREGRQNVHILGTKEYLDRKKRLEEQGLFGPSYVTISNEEISDLVNKFAGTGIITLDRNGHWDLQEVILGNDKVIGWVYNNFTGESIETTVFKIHYSKKGVHLVPDYPSKKK